MILAQSGFPADVDSASVFGYVIFNLNLKDQHIPFLKTHG